MVLKWFLNNAFTYGHQENVEMIKEAKEKTEVISLCREEYPDGFQLPLHYPSYNKADYEKMEEWRLDMLLKECGLCKENISLTSDILTRGIKIRKKSVCK